MKAFLLSVLISIVKINLFGDFMPANWVEEILLKFPDSVFTNIDTVLNQADFNIVNLESPSCIDGKPFEGKKYLYRFNPSLFNTFKRHHLNVFLLANNHSMDYGWECLNNTIQRIEAEDLYYAGAGKNLAEAIKGVILEKDGFKIGILNFAMTFPLEYYAKSDSPGIAPGIPRLVKKAIKNLRDKVDFLIVSFHFGGELLDTPKLYQREIAHRSIDWGADLVYGHHPHRVQPIEIYRGRLIVYSLGNFIFGSYSRKVNGAFIHLELKRDRTVYRIYPLDTDPIITGFAVRVYNNRKMLKFLAKSCNICRIKQGYIEVEFKK